MGGRLKQPPKSNDLQTVMHEASDALARIQLGGEKILESQKYASIKRGKDQYYIVCKTAEDAQKLIDTFSEKFPDIVLKAGRKDAIFVWITPPKERLEVPVAESGIVPKPISVDLRKRFVYPGELETYTDYVEQKIRKGEIPELTGKGVEVYLNVNTRYAVVLENGAAIWAGETMIGKPNEDMWTPLGLFTVTKTIDTRKEEYAYKAIPKYFDDFLECAGLAGFVINAKSRFAGAKYFSVANPFGLTKLEISAPTKEGTYRGFFGRTIKAPWVTKHIGGFVEVSLGEDPAYEHTYGCIGFNYVDLFRFKGTEADLLGKNLFDEKVRQELFERPKEGDSVLLKDGRKAVLKQNKWGELKFYTEEGNAVLLSSINWRKSDKFVWITKPPEQNKLFQMMARGTHIYVDGASVLTYGQGTDVKIVIKEGEYKELLSRLKLRAPTTMGEIMRHLNKQGIKLSDEVLTRLTEFAKETSMLPYSMVTAEGTKEIKL